MVFPDTTITISVSRYEQLVRAEKEGECLRNFIRAKHEGYGSVSYDELKTLNAMYFPEVSKDDSAT